MCLLALWVGGGGNGKSFECFLPASLSADVMDVIWRLIFQAKSSYASIELLLEMVTPSRAPNGSWG